MSASVNRTPRSRTDGRLVWVKTAPIKPPHSASRLATRLRSFEKRAQAIESLMNRELASDFAESHNVYRERTAFTHKLTSFLLEWSNLLAFTRDERLRAATLINRVVAMFGKYDGARAAFLLAIDVE